MPEYKYKFKEPAYYEMTMSGGDGEVVGTLRIKPSRILWWPANAKKWYSVSLDDFAVWAEQHGKRVEK
jgi:hypothetical protein